MRILGHRFLVLVGLVAFTACGDSRSSVLFTLRADGALTDVVTTVFVDGVEEPRLASSFASLVPTEDRALGSLALVVGDEVRQLAMVGRAVDANGSTVVARADVLIEKGKRVSGTLDFRAPTTIPLLLTTSGTGVGAITGYGGECRTQCTVMVPEHVPLLLTAVADSGATLAAWTGCTSTNDTECTVFPTAGAGVNAAFDGASFTLTVKTTFGAQGSGVVVSTPSRIDCGSNCTARFSSNAQVTLTPTLGVDVKHRWLDANCAGQAGDCTLTLDSDKEVTLLAARYNYAFVTSALYSSNLSGLEGADDKCNVEAAAANLPGTFVAWLAFRNPTTNVLGSDRVAGARGWVRTDGLPFYDDLSLLVPGVDYPKHKVLYPLRITADGVDIREELNTEVWTGMDGFTSAFGSAVEWMNALANFRVGSAVRGGMSWASHRAGPSNSSARLYCFGTDFYNELSPSIPTTATRIAFLSNLVSKTMGVAAMDAVCVADATAANLSGTFRAFVATTAFSAASRFDGNGAPWRRPDGVMIAETARDFLEFPSKHLAAITQYADGTFSNFNAVATGSSSALAPTLQLSHNCDDWTNAAQTEAPFTGDSSATNSSYFLGGVTLGAPPTCANETAVYCLQE